MTGSRPRLGFVGLGWIGRHRLESVRDSGLAEIAALVEPNEEMRALAQASAPGAEVVGSLESLWELGLDGVVIATPSALHASQSLAALERGVSVFCQKPLGRSAAEAGSVVEAARKANRLLQVDFCYRQTRALQEMRTLYQSGELGEVFAADLVFHNAYGPDKAWFYQRALSGGGCVMDLGVHLVDALLWVLDFPALVGTHSRVYCEGRPVQVMGATDSPVEDYANASLDLATGTVARLACSWRLSAGQDAVIGVDLYGTRGGASLRNVDGSFYDFVLDRCVGTSRQRLVDPPDSWGGRAVVQFAERLAAEPGYDPEAEQLVRVAEAIDAVYAQSGNSEV